MVPSGVVIEKNSTAPSIQAADIAHSSKTSSISRSSNRALNKADPINADLSPDMLIEAGEYIASFQLPENDIPQNSCDSRISSMVIP